MTDTELSKFSAGMKVRQRSPFRPYSTIRRDTGRVISVGAHYVTAEFVVIGAMFVTAEYSFTPNELEEKK